MTEIDELAVSDEQLASILSQEPVQWWVAPIIRELQQFRAMSRPSLSPAGVMEEQVDAALKAKPRNSTLAQWLGMTHVSEAGARELVRAALEAAAKAHPPAASDGWQDISTAPKDGTAFLVWCPDLRNSYLVMPKATDDVPWVSFGGGELPVWDRPTHWRPLPSPPSSKGGA